MTDQPTGFAESGYDPADDTSTAVERVSRLLQDLGLSEMPAAFAARTLRDAPDLLADLAIEAGGLEQVGWLDTWGRKHLLDMAKSPEGHAYDEASPHLESVYRRTPKEAGDA